MTTDTLEALREALKPCPFCGGEGQMLEVGGLNHWRISCSVCRASRSGLGQGSAIAAWNHRASPAATLGVEGVRPFGLSPLERARIKAPLIEALNAAWEHGNACGEGDNPEPFDPVARATAVLDHMNKDTNDELLHAYAAWAAAPAGEESRAAWTSVQEKALASGIEGRSSQIIPVLQKLYPQVEYPPRSEL